LVTFATYFFLKKACPENIKLASFGILVAFNPNFLMGSTSNQFSLVFCLLVVGLWVIYCRSPKTITAVGIVIGLIPVSYTHLDVYKRQAQELPKDTFKREVERHLTGQETEPWEIIYFKLYKSQLPVIEQALETASLMLGLSLIHI